MSYLSKSYKKESFENSLKSMVAGSGKTETNKFSPKSIKLIWNRLAAEIYICKIIRHIKVNAKFLRIPFFFSILGKMNYYEPFSVMAITCTFIIFHKHY